MLLRHFTKKRIRTDAEGNLGKTKGRSEKNNLGYTFFNIKNNSQSFKDRFVWYHQCVILNKAVFFVFWSRLMTERKRFAKKLGGFK